MRRIELNMKDQQAYEVIKELLEHGGNKNRAALTLGCCKRTINRYLVGYQTEGKAYFIHGNSGRKPAHAIPESVKENVVNLYKSTYYDANFDHYTELLEKMEDDPIVISRSSIGNILAEADILSPKATRKTRRAFKAKMKTKLKEAKTGKETTAIESKLIEAEDAHPRRPRCSYFGEMLQMDATLHLWVGGKKWTLHLAIDDAAGCIVGAWFEEQETLKGYYHVLEQILKKYGIPFMFYTDRRTVFEYRKSGSQDTADDTFTQFSYACKQLGIQIKTTSLPQAKGRIERLNQTMQSRLPIELRQKGVTSIEQANEFLPGFIAEYNARFALKIDSIPSVFSAQPSNDEIDRFLAVLTQRSIDSGHSVRFEKKFFRLLDKNGLPVYLYQGIKGLVIRTFSGKLFFSAADKIFALEEIPSHELSSKNFDIKPVSEKQKKRYIPPASHPWRASSFAAFVKKHSSQPA